jgi:hypothetical protein
VVTDQHCDLAPLRNEAACRAFAARDGFTQGISNGLLLGSQPLTMNRYLPVNVRFHSLSSRRRAMVVTCSAALRRLQTRPADELIGEFLGPARLVSGPGLAVVTATAPFKPRG